MVEREEEDEEEKADFPEYSLHKTLNLLSLKKRGGGKDDDFDVVGGCIR